MGGVMKTAKEEPHELCTKKPASKDRAKVLEEILDSERAYVGHLRDIVGVSGVRDYNDTDQHFHFHVLPFLRGWVGGNTGLPPEL